MSVDRTNSERMRRMRERQREHLLGLLGKRCAECGTELDLQFDHIDPKQKSFTIGNSLGRRPMVELERELRKCQLLCVVHHKIKTSREHHTKNRPDVGAIKHGTMTAYNRGCRCASCRTPRSDYYYSRLASKETA